MVNYKILTDFRQASHSLLPTHGWRKSVRNLCFSLCFSICGGWFKQPGFLVSDLKLWFCLVNYRFLTDFWQTSHIFLPTHGWRKSVRNLWFSLCFWFFGGWFKQLGFLVSDLKLSFYLVNYKFPTDFSQTSHSLLPTHGWRKSVRNLWFSLCFSIRGGWFKQLGFLVSDLKLWFCLVNFRFLTDFSQTSYRFLTDFSQVSHRFRTDFSQFSSYPPLKEICEKSVL